MYIDFFAHVSSEDGDSMVSWSIHFDQFENLYLFVFAFPVLSIVNRVITNGCSWNVDFPSLGYL